MPFKMLKLGRKTDDAARNNNKNETSKLSDCAGATARLPTKEERRARRRSVRIDMAQSSIANPDNDHSKDNEMGCFNYWHYRITRWVPDNRGGMDGKRETYAWTEHYARRMHFYERRQSEKKAAKVANKKQQQQQQQQHAKDEQKHERRKVGDVLARKTSSPGRALKDV